MSDTAWNLGELRRQVRARTDSSAPALELISSISRSDSIFAYHVRTARDALDGIINYEEPQGSQNWLLLLGGAENQEHFYDAKVESEANLIGCIYTVRSLAEVFAQLVNCLILETKLEVKECTLKKVAAQLSIGALKDQLEELTSSHWFGYVSAFVNTVKHRQLVQHMMSISFVENVAGIKVGAFQYEGRSYPAYWARDFLQGTIDVKNAVVAAGRTLNNAYIVPT